MKDLKCGLRDCVHNEGYSCCADKINVDQFTDCKTYKKSDKPKSDMWEAGIDFMPPSYSVDTSVACTADCVFAKNDRCVSNGITVMSAENEAACMTFIKT